VRILALTVRSEFAELINPRKEFQNLPGTEYSTCKIVSRLCRVERCQSKLARRMMCTFGCSRVRPSIPRAPGHQGKVSLSVGPEPLQELGILLPILLSHQSTATVDPSGPLITPEIPEDGYFRACVPFALCADPLTQVGIPDPVGGAVPLASPSNRCAEAVQPVRTNRTPQIVEFRVSTPRSSSAV
jgi:hypothetical protein